MATDELIVRGEGVAGFLTLNRPKAIHALTAPMDHAMTEALLAWRDDPAVKVVMIDHSEGRGFCAGGDVTALRHSALTDNGVSGRRFFYEEYQLNHLLFTYAKPVVAFMDGITMGGGVGISQPAKYRVATENTRYAMPETGIGLFPDVGGGWYLARIGNRIGQFLALTGARLDGAECMWAGLCTHYLPSEALAEAKRRIAAGEDIGAVLDSLSVEPPEPRIAGTLLRTASRTFLPRSKPTAANGRKRNWRRCAPRARRPAKFRCASLPRPRSSTISPPTWRWNTASAAAC
jgi:enoyl-CoA hydratase